MDEILFETALSLAMKLYINVRGNKEVIELLLAEEIEGTGVSWTNSEHSLSRAFLHAFSEEQDKQLMTRLLDKGAGVNEADTSGYTPLVVAVQRADLDSAQMPM